jgi:uncharacterized protein YjbJ (UPF0337 family)
MSAFTQQVKGNWTELKGKFKQQYADLTGKTREEVESEVSSWSK